MTEFEFEFYEERIHNLEELIVYCSNMMITSATASDYFRQYRRIEGCKAELEFWESRAREKGIYII